MCPTQYGVEVVGSGVHEDRRVVAVDENVEVVGHRCGIVSVLHGVGRMGCLLRSWGLLTSSVYATPRSGVVALSFPGGT